MAGPGGLGGLGGLFNDPELLTAFQDPEEPVIPVCLHWKLRRVLTIDAVYRVATGIKKSDDDLTYAFLTATRWHHPINRVLRNLV